MTIYPMTIPSILETASLDQKLEESLAKMVKNIQMISHDIYELIPAMKELMYALAEGITGLPINVEDYYESTENEIPSYMHYDISNALIWIATSNPLNHIGENYGPPAA